MNEHLDESTFGYRVTTQRDPHAARLIWDARIYQLPEDQLRTIASGETEAEAIEQARRWIRAEHGRDPESTTLIMDIDGNDLHPYSVKV
jgi:hypothetical protein